LLSNVVRNSNSDELVCFQRGANEEVPGCLGGLQDGSLSDYCVRKNDLNAEPTIETIPLKYTTDFPLARCEGKLFFLSLFKHFVFLNILALLGM